MHTTCGARRMLAKNPIDMPGNTTKLTCLTYPGHSTQQNSGDPNPSILISRFISKDVLSKHSFGYLFHLAFFIRLRLFTMYKSSNVIQDGAHHEICLP